MRRGRMILAGITVVTGVACSLAVGVSLVERERWLLAFVGTLFPLLGLAQWGYFRRQGGAVQEAADQMVWPVILTALVVLQLAWR